MSELLSRGYNVSVPEVDVGDDIHAEHPGGRRRFRVQVKIRSGEDHPQQPVSVARYHIPTRQLLTPQTPELYFVFALWRGESWDALIISRKSLHAIWAARHRGRRRVPVTNFAVTFHPDRIHGMGCDFGRYRNNWDRYWPRLTRRPANARWDRNAAPSSARSQPKPPQHEKSRGSVAGALSRNPSHSRR